MWDSVSGSRADFIFPIAKPLPQRTQRLTKETYRKVKINLPALVFLCVPSCPEPALSEVEGCLVVLTSSSDLPKRAYPEPSEQASKTYCEHGAARGRMTGLVPVVLAHERKDSDSS